MKSFQENSWNHWRKFWTQHIVLGVSLWSFSHLFISSLQERDVTKQLIFIKLTRGLHQLTPEMRGLFAMQTLGGSRGGDALGMRVFHGRWWWLGDVFFGGFGWEKWCFRNRLNDFHSHGGFRSHGEMLSSHPFLDGIWKNIYHPAVGLAPFQETSM